MQVSHIQYFNLCLSAMLVWNDVTNFYSLFITKNSLKYSIFHSTINGFAIKLYTLCIILFRRTGYFHMYNLSRVIMRIYIYVSRIIYNPTPMGRTNISGKLTITIIDIFWFILIHILLLLQICQFVILLEMEQEKT